MARQSARPFGRLGGDAIAEPMADEQAPERAAIRPVCARRSKGPPNGNPGLTGCYSSTRSMPSARTRSMNAFIQSSPSRRRASSTTM